MRKFTAILFLCLFALTLTTPCEAEAAAKNNRGGSMGTSSVGGIFYSWAGPWSKLVAESMPGYQITVEVTGGAVHNIKLVDSGELEFALSTMPALYDGFIGQDWAKGKKYDQVRALFPAIPNFVTMWSLAKSGIAKPEDINGKIFSGGPKGGTPDVYYRIVFDTLGIKPGKYVNSGYSDLVGQMGDGMVDVIGTTGSHPFSPIMETEASHEINIVDFSDEQMQRIVAKIPTWSIGDRPEGGYKKHTPARKVLTFQSMYITNKQLDEELAYNLTKLFYENLAKFESVYTLCAKMKPEDVLSSSIPVHRGAARYYKERGIVLPAKLLAE